MANPTGWFSPSLEIKGWYDTEFLIEGWFDEELIYTASAGSPYTLSADPASYILTGVNPTLTYVLSRVDYTLTLASGSYTYSGFTCDENITENLLPETYVITGFPIVVIRTVVILPTTYALTGSSNSFQSDRSLTLAVESYALTGVGNSLVYASQLVGSAASYALTGADIYTSRTYVFTLSPDSYSLTGTTGSLFGAFAESADISGYSITGGDVTCCRTYVHSADPSSYSLTGNSTTCTIGYGFSGASGSYSLTGSPTTFISALVLTTASGSYTSTGSAVTFVYTPSAGSPYTLIASPASYSFVIGFTLTGYEADLHSSATAVTHYNLILGSTTFALAGYPTVFILARKFDIASPSSYAISGFDSVFYDYVISSTPESYTITGVDATLTFYAPIFYNLTASSGSYSFQINFETTGYPVTFCLDRIIACDPGDYWIQGWVANDPVLDLESSSYDITGFEPLLIRTRQLLSDSNTYSYTGQYARIEKNTRYPPPELVLVDTIYGEFGELLGSSPMVDRTLKYDVDTGRFVKILSNKTVISL